VGRRSGRGIQALADPEHERTGGETADNDTESLRQRLLERERERVDRVPEIATVFAACADNIMVLDTDLRIRFINWTVPDLTPAGVLGTPVYELVPEESRLALRACFDRVKSSARPDRYTTNYVAEDGSVSFWESRVGPILSGGEVAGYVSISSNVSERAQGED
jgi:PAS domain S-box-containing protein